MSRRSIRLAEAVTSVTAADDSVQAELFEAEPQQFVTAFRGEAFAVVVRMENEAHLTLAVLAAQVLQGQIADQSAGGSEFDGDGEELPFLLQRRAVHPFGEGGR
jgi:hypothetical protein